jgi:DNA primase
MLMGIPDEDVAQVRAATDIVALIGEHAALRKQGRRWVGLCPFHPEKTPSFSVNAEEGFYYCFGCQASGDAITFVRATEHLDFVDAVRFLADRAGIAIHEDADGGVDRKKRNDLFEAVERAVAWYHERLLSSPDAGPARDYLRSRGYDGGVVRQFRLGWAPDDWDALQRALGLPERVLTDSGLGFVNRAGRAQDAFRARVIFPICDPSGRPVALGGRILPPRAGTEGRAAPGGGAGGERRPEPKYKNSIETPIYSKRRTLYALNWAKHDIVATGEVIVCEGYTDVIGCFTAGLPRAVATCGTALGEEHFTLLRNFGRRIVLAYDADRAGQSAISRVYEWERRHEVEVAVAAFPTGSDPGELARTDPEALRKAVAEARPFLQFRVDQVFAAADLSTVEGRARAADAALTTVAEHPDDLVRDQYVMQVADRCRLEPDRVRQRLEEARRHPPARPAQHRSAGRAGRGAQDHERAAPAGRTAPAPGERPRDERGAGPGHDDGDPGPVEYDDGPGPFDHPGAGLDEAPGRGSSGADRPAPAERPGLEALRLAVHRPEEVSERLDEVLFVVEVHRQAFAALAAADSLHQAVEEAPPEVAALLRRLTVEEPVIVGKPLVDPVDAVVAQLVRGAARRALTEMQSEMRTSSVDLATANPEASQVLRWIDELGEPERCREAEGRLLAWLVGRDRGSG